MKNSCLIEADLRNANINIDQIGNVASLYKAKLDPILERQIKEKFPHLLDALAEMKGRRRGRAIRRTAPWEVTPCGEDRVSLI